MLFSYFLLYVFIYYANKWLSDNWLKLVVAKVIGYFHASEENSYNYLLRTVFRN